MPALNIVPVKQPSGAWAVQRLDGEVVVGSFDSRAEAHAAIDGAMWEREHGATAELLSAGRDIVTFHDRTAADFDAMSPGDRARLAPAVDAEFSRLIGVLRSAVAKAEAA